MSFVSSNKIFFTHMTKEPNLFSMLKQLSHLLTDTVLDLLGSYIIFISSEIDVRPKFAFTFTFPDFFFVGIYCPKFCIAEEGSYISLHALLGFSVGRLCL